MGAEIPFILSRGRIPAGGFGRGSGGGPGFSGRYGRGAGWDVGGCRYGARRGRGETLLRKSVGNIVDGPRLAGESGIAEVAGISTSITGIAGIAGIARVAVAEARCCAQQEQLSYSEARAREPHGDGDIGANRRSMGWRMEVMICSGMLSAEALVEESDE
jgi:hypothetical protein